jgi:hypothetical protein
MSDDMKNSGRPLTGRMIVESLVTGASEEFAIINGVVRRRGKEMTVCFKCRGLQWVCENHPDRPWDIKIEGGCECGAGTLCECQLTEDVKAGIEKPVPPLGFRPERS